MVFCYQNCSDLLWEKIVLVIEKNFWKFKAEGWVFANFLRSLKNYFNSERLEQLFETEYFLSCYWRFLRFNTLAQQACGTIKMPIGANNLDVEKLQEQVANIITLSILTWKNNDYFSLLVVSKGRNLCYCWSLYLLINCQISYRA